MSTEYGIEVEFGVGSVDAWGVVLRGRVADTVLGAGEAWAAVGCEEVSRAKSSRMFRAASQPDKSNSPIATMCLTRLLIVIPAYPNDPSRRP